MDTQQQNPRMDNSATKPINPIKRSAKDLKRQSKKENKMANKYIKYVEYHYSLRKCKAKPQEYTTTPLCEQPKSKSQNNKSQGWCGDD